MYSLALQFILIGNVKDWMLPFQETSWLRYSYEAAIITHFGEYGGRIGEIWFDFLKFSSSTAHAVLPCSILGTPKSEPR